MEASLRRMIVPMAAVTALALVALWFPYRTLLGQSAQLDTVQHQINILAQQSQNIAAQEKALSSTEAATLLARQEYQLVQPGQRIIQIVANQTSGSISSGDPGNDPLVSPSASQGLVPVQTQAPAPAAATGFWARVQRTLEFWR